MIKDEKALLQYKGEPVSYGTINMIWNGFLGILIPSSIALGILALILVFRKG